MRRTFVSHSGQPFSNPRVAYRSPETKISSADFSVPCAVAPSKVKVRGPKEAKAGDQITMRCSTERSNPPAEVSWVVDGRPFESVSTITADPKGGWVTTSNITVNITGQVSQSTTLVRWRRACP